MGLINSFSQIHFFSALLNLGSEISHERPSFKQSSNTYGQTRTIRLCRLRDEYPSICRLSNVITLLQEAVSRKSRVNCFRCQPTYKGSSPIFRSYGTNCDLLFLSVRQDSPRACVQTEPGLWWMSFSVYCGPAMTVCSSRTLGRMIWVVLLPDLPYWWRRAQYVAQAEFGSGI